MGGAASGPFKALLLQKAGEAVVYSLKSIKDGDQDQFEAAIKKVTEKFCKTQGDIEPPLLTELKTKIKSVIVENFAEDLARMNERAVKAVAEKAKARAREKKVDELVAIYDANGKTLPTLADIASYREQKQKTAAKTGDSAQPEAYPVMISFRFGEALKHAKVLEKQLEEKGVKTYMCDSDMKGGANMPEEIAAALYEAKVIVLLASETYGRKTGNAIDTNEEMRFALDYEKEFVVKIGKESWKEMLTDIELSKRPRVEWDQPAELPPDVLTKLCDDLRKKGVSLTA